MTVIPKEYFTGDARVKWELFGLAISQRLRRLRTLKGASLSTVARETGIPRSAVATMDHPQPGANMQKVFTLLNLYKSALYYDVSVQFLLGDEDITGLSNTMYRKFRMLPMEAQTTISTLIDNLYNITLPANRVIVKMPQKDIV